MTLAHYAKAAVAFMSSFAAAFLLTVMFYPQLNNTQEDCRVEFVGYVDNTVYFWNCPPMNGGGLDLDEIVPGEIYSVESGGFDWFVFEPIMLGAVHVDQR